MKKAFVIVLLSITLMALAACGQSSHSTGGTITGLDKSHIASVASSTEIISSVGVLDATNSKEIELTGTLVRKEYTTSQTGMGWSAVVYWLELDSPTTIKYDSAINPSAETTFDMMSVAVAEQYGDDANKNLKNVKLAEWEPYLGKKITVRGGVFDTGNAHTFGKATMSGKVSSVK